MSQTPQIDHEFLKLIPPLGEEEFLQLEQNILAYGGCRDAVTLWDGVIVDGHNRFLICLKHGLEFEVREKAFHSRESAKLWILENQLGRRNLNDAARIELALCKADMLREKARRNLSDAGGDRRKSPLSKSSKIDGARVNVRKELAAAAGVSEGTLYSYMCIREDGSPALLEQVRSGKLRIGAAYKMLAREMERQLKKADKLYEYIEARVPFDDNDEGNRVIFQAYGEFEGWIVDFLRRMGYED